MQTPPGGTPRRTFLRLAALAPLAAACATLPAAPPGAAPAPATPPPAPGDALGTLRAFPLPDEAEPAAVFRAAVTGGRGG